jgi:hypothetical protein
MLGVTTEERTRIDGSVRLNGASDADTSGASYRPVEATDNAAGLCPRQPRRVAYCIDRLPDIEVCRCADAYRPHRVRWRINYQDCQVSRWVCAGDARWIARGLASAVVECHLRALYPGSSHGIDALPGAQRSSLRATFLHAAEPASSNTRAGSLNAALRQADVPEAGHACAEQGLQPAGVKHDTCVPL